ncbi:MAG: HsdM family class I SAM-dependent methyltransferase [Candidatus Hodarchaeales archaeon]|jgi:type I restriction-modification system DNA methylase subunit
MNFGILSPTYINFKNQLIAYWKADVSQKFLASFLDEWTKNFQTSDLDSNRIQELFINHSYLLIFSNIMISSYLREIQEEFPKYQESIERILSDFSLDNVNEFSFLKFLSSKNLEPIKHELKAQISEKLYKITDWVFEGDIFQEIYEQLVNKSNRHEKGEYYTPDWLCQLIIEETWDLWQKTKKNSQKARNPKILDPACGSGTFIFNFQLFYYRNQDFSKENENVLEITGFDINPIAVYITRINFIFSLPRNILVEILQQKSSPHLKIVNKNSLKDNPLLDSIEKTPGDHKFDILIGNPPWVVLRSISIPSYQKELKIDFIKYNLVSNKDVHLFSQLDLATLFFMKCSHRYLEKRGIIAFIMPKSVISGAIQHERFRAFRYPQLKLLLLYDLQNIKPLFLMPACVVFSIKGAINQYPVKMKVFEGKLPNLRSKLNEVKEIVSAKVIEYSPPFSKTKKSWYYDKFKVGISIFPRSFYFVKLKRKEGPYYFYETDPEIRKLAKPRWKEVNIEGKIESEFLFKTLLSWEMYPFGYKNLRTVILPITISSDTLSREFQPLNLESLRNKGKHVHQWFSKAEKLWIEKCTEKSKERFPTLLSRLNYNNLILDQNPQKRYLVSYSGTGTNITASVIDKQKRKRNSEGLPFLADVKVWFYETNNKSEAHYLCAVLNSNVVNQLIKPLQPQGLGGGRAIHRRALSFPIPEFKSEPLQSELTRLSLEAHIRLSTHQFQNTTKMRREVKEIITDILEEIDLRVNQLLDLDT